jgi:hypothetical protein
MEVYQTLKDYASFYFPKNLGRRLSE